MSSTHDKKGQLGDLMNFYVLLATASYSLTNAYKKSTDYSGTPHPTFPNLKYSAVRTRTFHNLVFKKRLS